MLSYIIFLVIGLLCIGLMLFLHELGHFAVARLFHVDVEVLSFGIGPRIAGYQGPKTEYRISLIPFGGYCRMSGSLDLTKALQDKASTLDRTEAGSYFSASPWRRFLIYLAGPLTNFLIAVLLFSAASMIPVERLSDPAIITPISEYPALFGSEIRQPNIHKGDILLSSGERKFLDWQDAEAFIASHDGQVIPITVNRDGMILDTSLVPHQTEDGWAYGIALLQRPIIGRTLSDEFQVGDEITAIDSHPVSWTYDIYAYDKSAFTLTIDREGKTIERRIDDGILPFAWQSGLRVSRDQIFPLSYAVNRSWDMFFSALSALGAFITFHFDEALQVLTGPIKAAESLGSITMAAFEQSSTSGIRGMLQLLGIVSVSLSAGNSLPIPTFDGGQMLMSLIEAIRRKALTPRTYVILQITGMVAALIIMVMMYSLDFKAYFLS